MDPTKIDALTQPRLRANYSHISQYTQSLILNIRCSPFTPVLRADFRHVGVREYSAVEKLHDIERCSNDARVFTQNEGLRNRNASVARCIRAHIMFVDRVENRELSLDLMRCLRDEWTCRLLTKYETRATVQL